MKYKEVLDKIENVLQGEAHLDELAKKKRDPFKILISTILSARTRDTNTRSATEKLFAKYNTPQLIAEADLEDLEELIRSTGFYKVKAARIKEVSKIIHESYDGKVPEEFEELINLPGVGAKTANCVLVYAFHIPAIPVDTHVHRVTKRLGLIPDTASREKAHHLLEEFVPPELYYPFHLNLIAHGRQICGSRDPKCEECTLQQHCDYYKATSIKS